jgi:hypothetical protein
MMRRMIRWSNVRSVRLCVPSALDGGRPRVRAVPAGLLRGDKKPERKDLKHLGRPTTAPIPCLAKPSTRALRLALPEGDAVRSTSDRLDAHPTQGKGTADALPDHEQPEISCRDGREMPVLVHFSGNPRVTRRVPVGGKGLACAPKRSSDLEVAPKLGQTRGGCAAERIGGRSGARASLTTSGRAP